MHLDYKGCTQECNQSYRRRIEPPRRVGFLFDGGCARFCRCRRRFSHRAIAPLSSPFQSPVPAPSPFSPAYSTAAMPYPSILMTLRSHRNCKGDFISYLNGRNLYVQKKNGRNLNKILVTVILSDLPSFPSHHFQVLYSCSCSEYEGTSHGDYRIRWLYQGANLCVFVCGRTVT